MENSPVDKEVIVNKIRELNLSGNTEEADILDEKFEQYNLMEGLLDKMHERYVSERVMNSVVVNNLEMMEMLVALEGSIDLYERYFELYLKTSE